MGERSRDRERGGGIRVGMNIFNSCGQTYCDICRFNVILEVDTPSALRNHFYFSSGVNKSCNYLTDYLLSSIGNMLRN